MNNAKEIAASVIKKPCGEEFGEEIRQFQGCPSVAATRGGRIFAAWYAGGTGEPQIENYCLLVYSDDGGKSFTKPYLVLTSSRENMIHTLDIELWVDPDGALHVFWVQNNVKPAPEKLGEYPKWQIPTVAGGYLFDDFVHAEWEMICMKPDAEEPAFSKPRYLFDGFMRNKPIVLKNGDWLYSLYNQVDNNFFYCISNDKGQTFRRITGGEKLPSWCDEPMSYQLTDGSVRTLARRRPMLTESFSFDGGENWTDGAESDIPNPESRIYIGRISSGRLLLVYNDSSESRKNMSIALSEDDGKSWKYKTCIDTRDWTSYPDADFRDDRIYIMYDRERVDAKEILFLSVTEQEIINGDVPKPEIISKPQN